METKHSKFGKAFSKMGIEARTRPRTVKCAICRQAFTAHSGKAKYCSTQCFNRSSYMRRTVGLYRILIHLHRQVDGLIGHSRRLDSKLLKISETFSLIESELGLDQDKIGKFWQD